MARSPEGATGPAPVQRPGAEGIGLPSLSTRDFKRLSAFVNARAGIKITEGKKVLFESRLQKRLRHLGLGDFSEYCDFLFSGEGIEAELHHMIDAVTTHKTDFFREADHFDFLSGVALPGLAEVPGKGRIVVWSAGCSTGEEPYTIAMILSEYAKGPAGAGLSFAILATDISNAVLQSARRAVYSEEQIVPIPVRLRERYLLRSRDRTKRIVRIAPELRAMICFSAVNLIENDFADIEPADIIFLRNVIIYFDREVQKKLLLAICGRLAPRGYLFMGHSEALHGFDLPLVRVGPSVYRRTA
ncbi:MAG: hypothetical protein M0Z58_09410 [Nitrospiraceae bacterium]|nr:hypothetical protein [Nitrospiraceae bacterium]